MDAESAQREEIGQRIKGLRQTKGLTLQKLAQLTEVSPGYLSEVERGRSAISFEKLVRIAQVLVVSVDFLHTGQGESEGNNVIRVPVGLSQAAEQLGLSYRATIRLLQGKESLIARRSQEAEEEWDVAKWIQFYRKVKEYLPEN